MVQAHKHHQMLTAPVNALLWRMTLPLVPAMALMLMTDLLESFLMARHSTAAITALGFSSPVITVMFAVAIALSICTNRRICEVRSANLGLEFSSSKNGLLLSAGAGLILTALAWFLLKPLLHMLGIDDSTSIQSQVLIPAQSLMSLTTEYTQIRLLGWVPLILIWQCNGVLRSLGLMKRSSALIVLWASVKATYLIWTMCWQNPNLSELLIETASLHAWVDSLFALLSCLVLWHGLGFRQVLNKPNTKTENNQKTTLKNHGQEALTVLLQQSLTPVSIAALTALAGQLNPTDVALIGMAYRIEAMSLIIPITFTASLPGLLACNWWAKNTRRVRTLLTAAFIGGAGVQLVIAILLVLFHSQVSGWLTQDIYLEQSLRTFLVWVPISFIGAGSVMVVISLLNIIGKVGYATVLGITHRLVLVVPLAATGAVFWGIDGIFIALFAGHSLALVLALFWCHSVGLIDLSFAFKILNPEKTETPDAGSTLDVPDSYTKTNF